MRAGIANPNPSMAAAYRRVCLVRAKRVCGHAMRQAVCLWWPVRVRSVHARAIVAWATRLGGLGVAERQRAALGIRAGEGIARGHAT
jgi:hypothetical protein